MSAVTVLVLRWWLEVFKLDLTQMRERFEIDSPVAHPFADARGALLLDPGDWAVAGLCAGALAHTISLRPRSRLDWRPEHANLRSRCA